MNPVRQQGYCLRATSLLTVVPKHVQAMTYEWLLFMGYLQLLLRAFRASL